MHSTVSMPMRVIGPHHDEVNMSNRRITPESLIELAISTLRAEIAPKLDGEARYQAAMVASALEIARRSIMTDGEQARFEVLDAIYDDGEGTLDQLAGDIRAGTISSKTHPELSAMLRRLVTEEVEVRNPKLLAARWDRPR